MKITFDVDMTPEEARRFFGLPDVQPMQQALLKDMQVQLQKNIARLDPETLLKQWFSLGPQSFDQFGKLFGNMAAMASARRKAKEG